MVCGNNVLTLPVQPGFEWCLWHFTLYLKVETCFFGYSGTHLVLSSVLVQLSWYINIRTILVFEGYDLVSVSDNLFRLFSLFLSNPDSSGVYDIYIIFKSWNLFFRIFGYLDIRFSVWFWFQFGYSDIEI